MNKHPHEPIHSLWLKFNQYSNQLAAELGRTNNIVGEYAERLACEFYSGSLVHASASGADVICPKGKRYQVKARKVKDNRATSLSAIRCWEFDYLVVIIFDATGRVTRALELPRESAQKHSRHSTHVSAEIITTNQALFSDPKARDITAPLSNTQRSLS